MAFNPRLTRRELLKAGASSAILAFAGCGGNSGGSPPPPDDEITGAAIYPGIGFARIGNSANEYFLGPELPGVPPVSAGGFKDTSGAIKRQAARFRVYGLDAAGRVVRELTADDADIVWEVHLANRKAAWYDFDTALDIPEAENTPRRNATIAGAERERLVIDPGAREIAGRNVSGVLFDGARFINADLEPIGELRTDAAGRLLVLGGKGNSQSPLEAPLTTFANNDLWCDDTSDGPVRATVRLNGRDLPVKPAWVVVAPPNFAPGLAGGFRTLYDVVSQTMVDAGLLSPPATITFLGQIFPLFDRLAQLQWVNQGVLNRYGWKSPEDFLDPDFVRALADPSPDNAAFRRSWFERFRNPDFTTIEADTLPPIYGDAVNFPQTSPRGFNAVTPVQYQQLGRWADGDFINDLDSAPGPTEFEDLPPPAQAAALDRAALEACLGDAFHPGCEVTWPIRVASMYDGLFRLRHRAGPEADFGDVLTPAEALSATGPLVASGPGDLTRWMAVPWQTDTASCRFAYQRQLDPYLPTFWPARVPNHVLTRENYEIAIDTARPLEARQDAFANRLPFFRGIDAGNAGPLETMVESWFKLGLVSDRPGPGDGEFPEVMKVETDYDFE